MALLKGLSFSRLKGRRKPAPGVETLAPHAPVAVADPYSFQVGHRRMAWLLRISAGLNISLGVVVVVLCMAISTLLPLKTTEIALLRTDPSDNRVYRIEPITRNVPGFDLLMESMARRYVRELLAIDSVSQTERFRWAFRMTDLDFYKRFSAERFKPVEDALKSGLNRSITVESVDRIASAAGVYKFAVDFVQTDERKGEVVEKRKLRAYLNITTRPQRVREPDKYDNPLGITVLDLVLKERANS
ncbi:VirB8/TrbF family protein [Ferrovibrio sp.]|uniref:VirB8/TrbF family protein n=1 Tax=Ferrovibrio sp. TaxID=1917215 RepID=UPI00311F5701